MTCISNVTRGTYFRGIIQIVNSKSNENPIKGLTSEMTYSIMSIWSPKTISMMPVESGKDVVME